MKQKQLFCLSLMCVFLLTSSSLFGANYYIDSSNGNDGNTGLSMNTAWKTLTPVNATTFSPGDSILFKSDGVWTGQLTLKGSGNESNPIVVSNYGTGNRPIIDGNGTVNYGVLLENVDYWHIENLEITNPSATEGSRIGVFIHSTSGTRKHFRLRNLFIHNIMGRYSFEIIGKNTGGIGIIGEGDSKFDDIIIENCEIGNIVRVGIFTNGNTGTRGDRPITNLIIRNNIIHHCAGDGAIIRYAYRPLIEYNTAYENHNADQSLVKYGVALWCRSTDEALFQYNEVYNTRGNMDGQAFDTDLEAYRTIVQYNYSHDNEGGFMLIMGSSSEAIVRHNISVNDGAFNQSVFRFATNTSGNMSGIFHNNVIYISSGKNIVINLGSLSSAKFYNNIFYNDGDGNLGETAEYKNNCMFGYSVSDRLRVSSFINADPLFVQAGANGIGRNNADGYKLQSGSPCFDNGIPKSKIPGYWLPDMGESDFWGNDLSGGTDIGAFSDMGGSTNAAPVVSLTEPANNSAVGINSPVTISAASSDSDGSISKVEFYLNSSVIPINAAPYSISWSPAVSGNYAITAVATDNKLASTTSNTINVIAGEFNGDATYHTLNPIEDAFVRGGTYAAENYGTSTDLICKSAPLESFSRKDILKFDVRGKSDVKYALVRLYARTVSPFSVTAYETTDAWTETAVNWNNTPPIGNKIATTAITAADTYYEWDVTSYVAREAEGDGIVSLLFQEDAESDKQIIFNSREATANLPQLVMVTNNGNTSIPNETESNSLINYIYPNPAQDQLNMILKSSDITYLTIYNMIGFSVFNQELSPLETGLLTINIEALKPGSYFLRVSNKNVSSTKMFMKN
jgi:hypothetical protein